MEILEPILFIGANGRRNRSLQYILLSSDFKTNKKFSRDTINQDRAGDSQFNTLQMNLSSAFNLIQDSTQQLRVGFQTGITSRGIRSDALTMDAQYNGVQFDPNLPTNESFQIYNRIYGNLNWYKLPMSTTKPFHSI